MKIIITLITTNIATRSFKNPAESRPHFSGLQFLFRITELYYQNTQYYKFLDILRYCYQSLSVNKKREKKQEKNILTQWKDTE